MPAADAEEISYPEYTSDFEDRQPTYAERMPKDKRAGRLPRVTAYCTAESYKIKEFQAAMKARHGLQGRLYDECLYTDYGTILEDILAQATKEAQSSKTKRSRSRHSTIESLRGRSQTPSYYNQHQKFNDDLTSYDDVVYEHKNSSEVFVFEYGVVVLWGMTEEEEIYFLRHEISPFEVQPLVADDIQVEEFHFQVDPTRQPRIFNDMVTLKV